MTTYEVWLPGKSDALTVQADHVMVHEGYLIFSRMIDGAMTYSETFAPRCWTRWKLEASKDGCTTRVLFDPKNIGDRNHLPPPQEDHEGIAIMREFPVEWPK